MLCKSKVCLSGAGNDGADTQTSCLVSLRLTNTHQIMYAHPVAPDHPQLELVITETAEPACLCQKQRCHTQTDGSDVRLCARRTARKTKVQSTTVTHQTKGWVFSHSPLLSRSAPLVGRWVGNNQRTRNLSLHQTHFYRPRWQQINTDRRWSWIPNVCSQSKIKDSWLL